MRFSIPTTPGARPHSSAFLDVLFILLATFILVTTLSDESQHDPEEAMVEVHLPVLEHHEGRAPDAPPLEEMTLALKGDGEVRFDGAALGRGSTALRRLEALVRERLHGASSPYVRMFADERAEVRELLPLIALLKELGVAKIDLMGEDGKALGGGAGTGGGR